MAEKLLDLSQPIDVPLLDATVSAFYGKGSKEERAAAEQISRDLQAHPDTWLQVGSILQNSQNLETKFFLLQVIEGVIKCGWNALPVEQWDGIKNCISDLIFQLSSNEASFRSERLYVNKLNVILVQVFKHEWPSRWPGFIPDLVSAAKSSETICENCMAILKLLSEEVFDFSRGEMTQQKIKELKQSLNSEFRLIHELCLYVLSISQRPELIRATLATLHAFLSWIPLGYIFESPLLDTLLNLFPAAAYRNLALQCLTEVAALNFGVFYDAQFVKLYTSFMAQLQNILPPGTNIPEAYANGSTEEQSFIRNLALFFTSFYKSHIRVLENRAALTGLQYLIRISYVDDTEAVKVCLDYFNTLVSELSEAHHSSDNPDATANVMGLQMLEKLSKQLNGEDCSCNHLNTLCQAILSVSDSVTKDQENQFLVTVIHGLLYLHEDIKGKDNKAVIAINIINVVEQYPLWRAQWKLLKTVVNKLFEFMRETHPEVQDVGCDAFLKIVQKCKRKFVVVQVGEAEPFVSEILTGLASTVAVLQSHQIHTFYESMGHMIQAELDPQKRCEYLQRLMELPNQKWAEIKAQALRSVDYLKDQNVIKMVLIIMKTNTSVALSFGTFFLQQISLYFEDMLIFYRFYSELLSNSIAEGGPFASKTSYVKLLKSVKSETLKLIETFVVEAEDQPDIGKEFVRCMMDPILGDYARNVPDARESEVLSLFATIINKYKVVMVEDVPQIFEAVFACTLEMITKNFEDYPEHRLKFFSLLHVIASYCFRALFALSSQQLKLVMDSIIWAFRHTGRNIGESGWAFRHTEGNIAETGLYLLFEMLKNFQIPEFCNQFHQSYFLTIEEEIFAVLTDTFDKPGFEHYVHILQHLFCLVDSGALTQRLWDINALGLTAYPSNTVFVREYTVKLLRRSFPNMTVTEVTQFVDGLFESRNDLSSFMNHIRNFLVQSKEFSAQDNKDRYAEEAAAQREREYQIHGLIAPSELQESLERKCTLDPGSSGNPEQPATLQKTISSSHKQVNNNLVVNGENEALKEENKLDKNRKGKAPIDSIQQLSYGSKDSLDEKNRKGKAPIDSIQQQSYVSKDSLDKKNRKGKAPIDIIQQQSYVSNTSMDPGTSVSHEQPATLKKIISLSLQQVIDKLDVIGENEALKQQNKKNRKGKTPIDSIQHQSYDSKGSLDKNRKGKAPIGLRMSVSFEVPGQLLGEGSEGSSGSSGSSQ